MILTLLLAQRVVELLRAELQKAGAATRKSSAIRAAQVEAARRAEENRRWQEERQKGEERRRREEALVRDLDKRLDLWLAAVRYRQLADAVEAMGTSGRR